MIEKWEDVKDFKGVYQVSSFGRIKRLPTMVKKGRGVGLKRCKERVLGLTKRQYYQSVTLCVNGTRKSMSVHRLVAEAFLPNPENKPCVNHIDGIKSNNRIDNLEWCTYSENESHSVHTLNKIPNVSHFKEVENNDKIIRFNNKNIYGIKLQQLFKRLTSGEVIKIDKLSMTERSRFYGHVYELKSRYNLPIKTKRLKGLPSYKEYYL